jgi:hypothetical protein
VIGFVFLQQAEPIPTVAGLLIGFPLMIVKATIEITLSESQNICACEPQLIKTTVACRSGNSRKCTSYFKDQLSIRVALRI